MNGHLIHTFSHGLEASTKFHASYMFLFVVVVAAAGSRDM